MPRARSSRACSRSSPWSVMPRLASPSVRSRARLTASALQSSGDLLAAGQPAAGQVGAAAGVDAADGIDRLPASATAGGRGLDHDTDLVVVGDDGETVVVVEPADTVDDGLLGQLELLPGHGARAIDDEGEVDRRPAPGLRRRRRGELHEHEAVAPVVGADVAPVGAGTDGDGGLVGHDGSSSSRSRAMAIRRSTRLAVALASGRRMWSSTSGARSIRSHWERSSRTSGTGDGGAIAASGAGAAGAVGAGRASAKVVDIRYRAGASATLVLPVTRRM